MGAIFWVMLKKDFGLGFNTNNSTITWNLRHDALPFKESINFFLFFVSPQWWDSADSKRDQPCNHTRTKNQGQVWAGRILPCEYWCDWHMCSTPTQTQTICAVYIIQISTYIHTNADNCFCSAAEGGRQSVSVCCSHLLSPQLQLQTSNATWGHIAFQMSPRHMSVCVAKRKRQHERDCVHVWVRDRGRGCFGGIKKKIKITQNLKLKSNNRFCA